VAEERTERRLAAILAADVVGYSRLMGEDEEGTLNALNAHYTELIEPRITEHNGRIVKTTGDGLLVEFASVVDAVQCAVSVQGYMAGRNSHTPENRKIDFRIGINLGDVIVQNDDVFGDGVNVAARLEGLADPGGICISRAARDQIRDKLDYGLEDLGEVEVKNIARPVRAFRVLRDGAAAKAPIQSASNKRWSALAATLAVVLIAGGGLWWWQPWIERVAPTRPDRIAIPLPDKPSIAILPFTNLSGDSKQDYFTDGFTEDLITNVAQSHELFVISGNSTFTYKRRAVKTRKVAEELGVRYIVEGSIRRIGDKFRINAQLIDATDGVLVWAKRYDRSMTKLFDTQDEISREIAGSLLVNISKADLTKSLRKRPIYLSAYDYVLQARAKNKVAGKTAMLVARELAKKAIAFDPDYAPAYVELGVTLNRAYINQWEGSESLRWAYSTARKAVELDPTSSVAQEFLGRVLLRFRQHDEAIATIEKSIALNPNRADNYANLADVLTFAGRAEEAIELMNKAIRLNPIYRGRWDMYLGRAYYFSKQYDQAISQLKTCAARAPKRRACYLYLIPSYAELDRQADAKRALAKLLELKPKFSISASVENHLPFVPSAMQFYVEGLREAGVPE
jgi:adenylate cyclase